MSEGTLESVEGRGIRKLVQQPSDLVDRLLSNLQSAEFIYEQPATADVAYTFKHALTRQVADESLLNERRKLLHERVGQAIEALYAEHLDDHYSELAHHYRSSNNAVKAVEYLRLAGEQAAERGAYAQALANVEPAVKLIERLPERVPRLRAELGVRLLEGRIVRVLYGAASTERLQTFERVCELSERLGDASALLRGRYGVASAYTNNREVVRGLEISRRCLELAEQNQNGEMLPAIHYPLASGAYFSGDLLQASSRFTDLRFTDLMKPLGAAHLRAAADLLPVNLWATIPGNFALVQHQLGRADEALRLSGEALSRARQLKHSFTHASLAAVIRQRRQSDQCSHLLAVERAQLGQLGQQHRAQHLSNPGYTAQDLGLAPPRLRTAHGFIDLVIEIFEAALEIADVVANFLAQFRKGALESVFFGHQHFQQLLAPGDQCL
jgi:tetratricopeptide (TPR) repeat protein